MLNRKEMMTQKAILPVVSLMRLIKAHSSDRKAIICVFEGEDAKYYGSRIDSIINDTNRKNIECKGKKNLISLKKKIDENKNLSDVKVLFFADRDFDFEDKTNNNIYFTPCHSIENLYVNETTLTRILTDEYGICTIDQKEHYDHIVNLFSGLIDKICIATLDLNSWLLQQIKKSEGEQNIKLNLNNTKITDFIRISLEDIEIKYDIESLENTFSNSTKISQDELDTAKAILMSNGARDSIRGKYMLQFFRQFMEKLNNELSNKDSDLIKINIKSNLLLNDKNIISALSQYAITPDCLYRFLSDHRPLALAS